MHADALLSIMRFIASDSKVARHIRGVVLEIVGLLIRLTFCPINCVVYATTSLISALCHFDLL